MVKLDETQTLVVITALISITMYVRVELDFKRNVFRIIGHGIATVLLLLLAIFELSFISISIVLSWLLLSCVYLFVNELIRIYLRKKKMTDILQNHPKLYWLTRGKLKHRPAL